MRLGYGDFHRNTGIRDSAYTHATREVFYRAPTKEELLGLDHRDRLPTGYESLYDKLKKAQSTEEERRIINEYLTEIKKADPKGYARLEVELKGGNYTRAYGIQNTYAWEKVTAYNRDTHETQVFYRRIADRWSDDVFRDDWDDDAKKWSKLDWLDSAKMQQKAEEMWDGAVVGSIETDRAAQTNTAVRDDSSGLLPGGHYDFTYQFMGYADYKGNHNLGDLGDGNHPSDFGDTLRGSSVDWNADFEHLTREEARRRATAGNWDKHYTEKTAQIYKDMSWGSYLATKSMNDWWKPEGGSNLPLQSLFGKLGGIVRVEGTVLKRDRTPALRRAAYVQVKRAISPAVGVQAFYLRSVHDRTHEMMFANGDHNDIYHYDRLANVVGIGAAWQAGPHVRLSADWGRNMTDFGRMMNGSIVYTHEADSSKYTIDGRRPGSTPSFYVLRCDIGVSDTDRPGSWNAFVDYKYFEHGSFFGGNGTEGVPDRYIDGIKSFTVGAGYVPVENLLVEAFYTFGAKGINKRDTLYGAENFKLGDYARVQVTYKF